MMSDFLEQYLDQAKIPDHDFDVIRIKTYEIDVVNEKFEQELGNDQTMEMNKRKIHLSKSKYKRISIDKGLGKIIEKLNKEKIMITIHSCIGHDQAGYFSGYCFDKDREKIVSLIKDEMKCTITIDNDKNEKCWKNLENGMKFQCFRMYK